LARAAAILIENGKIAMIERRRSGHVYYLFPGGRIEFGEWPTETAVREIAEELGLEVEIRQLVAQIIFNRRMQYYFLVDRRGGEFGSGTGAEMDSPPDSKRGSYTPVWLPLDELQQHTVHPRKIVQLVLASIQHGWPEEVQHYVENT
jgi:8-oxo-dGTP diphosphatase